MTRARPTEELLREVFAVHEDSLFVQVGLWALLSRRTGAWAVASSDDGGPDDVAMALLERHFAPLHAARGLPPPFPAICPTCSTQVWDAVLSKLANRSPTRLTRRSMSGFN